MGGGRRLTGGTGFGRKWPLVSAGSGEKFRQPGGTLFRGTKGEKERESRAIRRRGAGEETAGHLVGN
jgi:hypothetical protein